MPVATDEIDLSQVTFLHTDVREWRITSKLTDVDLPAPGQLGVRCVHTKAGKWPVSEGSEGVLWILAQIGGRWYAATCEWLRPGQTFKPTLDTENIGPHTEVEPLASWRPQPGEVVGVMVSTTGGRNKKRHTVAERSQVVRVIWPGAVQQPQPPAPPAAPKPEPTPALPKGLRLCSYGELLDASDRIAQAYRAKHGRDPAPRDIAHNLWRFTREAHIYTSIEDVARNV